MADELDETPAAAADHVGDGKPGKPPAGKKGKDHKQAIIVIVSTVGVIIAWMSYRASKGKSSGQGATPGAATSPYLTSAAAQQANGGNVAGYGDPSASAGFNSLMQNMQAEIEALNALLTPSGTTTPVGVTPAPITTPTSGPKNPERGFQFTKGLTYIRNAHSGLISQVEKNGSIVGLNSQQWAAARGGLGAHINAQYGTAPPAKKTPVVKPR